MTIKKESKTSPESIVREIKRKTSRKFSAEAIFSPICILCNYLKKNELAFL